MNLHDVLSDLIKTVNAGSFSAAFNALAEISKLCRKDTTAVSKFCDLKGIITLLGLIEKPKFSDITLSILANCCLVDKVREEESIRNRACRGLANIALTSRGARELHRCEATQHIAELLTSAKLKDTQLTALRALRILANIPNCRDDLVKHKAPAAIAKLLLTEPLQKSALQALTTVTQSCSVECAMQVKEADGFKFLEELLSASDTTLLEGAFVLLVNLSVVEDVRPDLGAVGAVTSLVAQLNDYTLSKPSYGALFSALCRYSQESVNRIRVRETGGLSLFVDVLASKDKKDMWQCTTCAILQFRYDEPSLEKLWDLNLASTVLDHLESYIEEHKQEEHTSGDCAGQATDTVQGDGSQDATSASIKDSVGQKKGAPEVKEDKAGNAKKQENNRQDDVSDTKGTVNTDVPVNDVVKEDKLQDCNQTWHREREEDFTDNSSTRKSEAIDFDEDDPELEANMGKVGSKVFCVHSPSYQEIQNENAAQHFEVNSTDSGYKSYQCSPNSPDYYCLPVSPRTAARSPRSPDSGVWSSCSSPRCESPVSVASPEPFRCFSPSLLATLISVAESGFGSGVLAHCLLTCERKAQQHCCLTIPYIVRNKLILRQLLLECTGLELLLDMLEGNKDCRALFSDAAASLQALCISIAAPKAKRNTETSEKPDLVNTSSCFLGKFTTDVQFRMEDGSVVEGNRDQLSETNDYFRRMLSGHFQESNQSIVAFHCTRKTPLSVVVHFLHGCSFGSCPFLKAETTVRVDLEVLGLCDLLLLPELQRMTETRVKQCVKLEHVCDAYTKALELGMEDLRMAVLWYALTEKCDEETWNRCLHDLVFGPHGGQVLDDVASLVRRNSYSCVVADSAMESCL
ncbi:hypothetical protein IscW_ISCW009898 [Ixodes scapularis]|uniref:BTB domain-containing protein n=1 Tax=Ixodes scapularis TaxID=6945 RepID=B7Q0A3_IXOSC|nr:hypothetical protein IscW_ISCW009898 [Ixodes scapularis]|eukprot:XP_002407361.1 hypothetical protein IscW_ISCW009898 [Ixodes scapularis]